MHYIKDIFKGKQSEHTHDKFIRYSRGNFTGALLKIMVSKKNIRVNTSFHLIDEILSLLADHLKNKEIEIKGTLSWNKDLGPELEEQGIKYLKVSKARGIFKYVLQNKVKFKDFVTAFSKYHLLISFKEEDIKLSTKNKLPKPNKEVSNLFCKTTFPKSMQKKVLKEFLFDTKEVPTKVCLIEHNIEVNEINLPDIDDFDKARRLAKRKGIITRKIKVDTNDEVESKIDFNV